MQFWSGTAFMRTSDVLAVPRMFDEAGYDGIVCSDHMIYPRALASPYPDSPTGKPMWSPDTAWLDSRGIRADGPGLRQPRQATQRDDPGYARAVARRLGVLERRALPSARVD